MGVSFSHMKFYKAQQMVANKTDIEYYKANKKLN